MSSGPTIYVHVGLPKTGTTFLQDLLRQHADALEREACAIRWSVLPTTSCPLWTPAAS
jgi:hypothetical protein